MILGRARVAAVLAALAGIAVSAVSAKEECVGRTDLGYKKKPYFDEWDGKCSKDWKGYCGVADLQDDCSASYWEECTCEIGAYWSISEGAYSAKYMRELREGCPKMCPGAGDYYAEWDGDCWKGWKGWCNKIQMATTCTPGKVQLGLCEVGGVYYEGEGLYSAAYMKELGESCPDICFGWDGSPVQEGAKPPYFAEWDGECSSDWKGWCDITITAPGCTADAIEAGTCEVGGVYWSDEGLYSAAYMRALGESCPKLCSGWVQEPDCESAGESKKKCKKIEGCRYKKKKCTAKPDCESAGKSKKKCKKIDGCRYKKKKCIAK